MLVSSALHLAFGISVIAERPVPQFSFSEVEQCRMEAAISFSYDIYVGHSKDCLITVDFKANMYQNLTHNEIKF